LGAILVSGSGKDIKNGIANYVEKNGYGPKIILVDIPRSLLVN
jgi:hypothetical protein